MWSPPRRLSSLPLLSSLSPPDQSVHLSAFRLKGPLVFPALPEPDLYGPVSEHLPQFSVIPWGTRPSPAPPWGTHTGCQPAESWTAWLASWPVPDTVGGNS